MTIPSAASNGATPSMRHGTGLVLRDALPRHQLLQVVHTAEETGYEAVFVPEIAGREAFATLAALSSATSRMGLGTGVVTVQARSPVTTAMGAATLQELSGGRFVLGLGAGAAPNPLRAVEEYACVVRAILAGENVTNERLGVSNFTLGLLLERSPPPIWLAALGDRMMSLAGRIADGVLLNWCTPERVAQARDIVDRSATEAGRSPSDVTVAVYVRGCIGVEDAVAYDALRAATAQYAAIPHYANQLVQMGLGEESRIAARALESGGLADVPARLVRALTVMGGRRDALDRFDAYRRAGADVVLWYPVPALDPFSSILGTLLAAAPSPALER
ncbi:MAG TPA: LLM class flavin-dependent oxidoreductase [Actinomycetota bacterium]|nr:LLM class flavin-dependent oxidoreductase [Actinomycetota bacterium]